MSGIIPIVIVGGLFAALLIGWIMIIRQPENWLPPGSNPTSTYGHKDKPKPPANPPKGQ